MELFLQDIKFGARILVRAPLISTCIVLILALAIGANAAMFGLIDTLLLHAVRYPQPEKLVFVWSYDPQGEFSDLSAGDFAYLRAQSKTLSDLAVWTPRTVIVLGGERPRQVGAARVSAAFFRTLRVKPLLGRTFLPDEDGLDNPADAGRTAVISARFWKQDLGSDPNVLGRTISIDSAPYTVIGVMPEDFQFWWEPDDLWVPANLRKTEHDYHDCVVIARMNDSRERVSAELSSIARSLGEAFPKSDKGWTLRTEDFQERLLDRTFRVRLLLLSAAVGLVLLIACANVGGLLVARSAARTRELAVRVSLGATSARLARQLLTESALLAIIGGALGLAFAWRFIAALPAIVPAGSIPGEAVQLSGTVVLFCIGISALTCILVGITPALFAARSETSGALKESSRSATAGPGRNRVRKILVAGEVALALIVLSSAWLMADSFRTLMRLDRGFNSSNVLMARILLPGAKYDTRRAVQFHRQALERIRSIAGVQNAAMGTSSPINNPMRVRFDLEGSSREQGERPSVPYSAVSEDYFRTLGTPLLRGRFFTAADRADAPPVAIVSQALASRYFNGGDAVGKQIIVNRPARGLGEESVKMEIVGVVGNINLAEAELAAAIYVPHAQNPFTRGVWYAIRTNGNAASLASAIRSEFMALDREQPVEQIGPLDQLVSAQYAQPRFQTGLMGTFAGLAMILAALGIYGVNAYAVAQRRNEIGIRMALGATRGAVLRYVIAEGLRPTFFGIAIGTAGTLMLTSWLRAFLIGTAPIDPAAFIGAALLLAAVAALACYLPALKAVRIDPAITLRSE